MALPGFTKHPKFLRLVHLLGEPVPHVLGYLECLWATAYELAGAPIGDSLDVELAAQYPGEAGKLTGALVKVRLLDPIEGDRYAVHDLLDHAPLYVQRRASRADEATVDKWCDRCGELFRSGERRARFCSDTCRKMSHKRQVTQGDAGGDARVTKVTQGDAVPLPSPPLPAQHSTEGEESPSTPSCTEPEEPARVPASDATVEEVQESPREQPLLTFPCAGKIRAWYLLPAQVREWSELFPGIDVLGECRKALAWVQANSRKTAKGMPRFLVGWLGRCQDRGARNPTGPPPRPASRKESLDEQLARLRASGQVT